MAILGETNEDEINLSVVIVKSKLRGGGGKSHPFSGCNWEASPN